MPATAFPNMHVVLFYLFLLFDKEPYGKVRTTSRWADRQRFLELEDTPKPDRRPRETPMIANADGMRKGAGEGENLKGWDVTPSLPLCFWDQSDRCVCVYASPLTVCWLDHEHFQEEASGPR